MQASHLSKCLAFMEETFGMPSKYTMKIGTGLSGYLVQIWRVPSWYVGTVQVRIHPMPPFKLQYLWGPDYQVVCMWVPRWDSVGS
jgi:hypothetical protein